MQLVPGPLSSEPNNVSSALSLPPPSSSPLMDTVSLGQHVGVTPWGAHTLSLTSGVRFVAPMWLTGRAETELRRVWGPGRRPPRSAGGTGGHRDRQSSEGCRRTSPAHAQRTGTPHRRPPAPDKGKDISSMRQRNAAHILVPWRLVVFQFVESTCDEFKKQLQRKKHRSIWFWLFENLRTHFH